MSLYIVAQSEHPGEHGGNFSEISKTPHLTLLPRSTVEPEQVESFVQTVERFLKTVAPLELEVNGEDSFYSAQLGKNVSVALIEKTDELEHLHAALLTALVGAGGSVDTPEFTGSGWNPHMSDWGVNDPVPPMPYVVVSQSTMVDEILTTSIIAVVELNARPE